MSAVGIRFSLHYCLSLTVSSSNNHYPLVLWLLYDFFLLLFHPSSQPSHLCFFSKHASKSSQSLLLHFFGYVTSLLLNLPIPNRIRSSHLLKFSFLKLSFLFYIKCPIFRSIHIVARSNNSFFMVSSHMKFRLLRYNLMKNTACLLQTPTILSFGILWLSHQFYCWFYGLTRRTK